MTPRSRSQLENHAGGLQWAGRILALALAGILFLTLYPFRFVLDPLLSQQPSPFLLRGFGKSSDLLDVVLNVVLFVPYGFGLAGLIQARVKSRARRMVLVFAGGALLSYAIEVMQCFIPGRDSGWEDVITNSSGALLGAFAFLLCGPALLRFASSCEQATQRRATPKNVAGALVPYFAAWFLLSAHLQKDARLSVWKSEEALSVGNSASGEIASPWKGRVYALEFWDHALSDDTARRLTLSGSAATLDENPFAAYDLSGSPPFPDRRGVLPDLDCSPGDPLRRGESVTGSTCLTTRTPVSALAAAIRKSRQFAIRVRCEPSRVDDAGAQIVAISQPSGVASLEIRQDHSALALWLLNPGSPRRPALTLNDPNVFESGEPRDVVLSYDGANIVMTINGRISKRLYRSGPATALARLLRRGKAVELQGYRYIFYAIVFFPQGCLLGLAWRHIVIRSFGDKVWIALMWLVPCPLLEWILVRAGGQAFSAENVALALAAACAGGLWVNLGADRLGVAKTAAPHAAGA